MPILTVDNVTIRFGGLLAVDKVSLEVEEGMILALIGPNGAGKSTMFNLITGIYQPTEGRIAFGGRQIGGWRPDSIAACGIGRTFQNIRLFRELTVLENVMIGAHTQGSFGLVGALLRFLPTVKKQEDDLMEMAMACLDRVDLAGKALDMAANLSYGEQRRLEIARALALRPKLILLDEPAAGMNPLEKMVLMDMVQEIRASGVTVFLVEHDMKFVMGLSDRIVVLDYGVKIAEGTPSEIKTNPRVIEAYLGKGAAHA